MSTNKGREAWKILGNVFDEHTLNILHWLSNKGYFDDVTRTLKVGKEANLFLATKDKSFVVVKIYRVENCNFNKMLQYIRGDPRFPNIASRKREVVFAWTQREFRNIHVARQAGARVPLPIIQKSNVLVEEFIGKQDGNSLYPALQLKNVEFETDEDITRCHTEIVNQIVLLWKKAKIVHGDLSEFNILFHEDKPVFIDFSQGTSINDFNARDYLKRDCTNIDRFFKKIGLETDTYEEVISNIN
jgi:RIO kinase 1